MTTRERGTLAAAILASGVVFLDTTVLYIALPRIGATLPATVVGTLEGQTYVASGYLATLAAFLVLGGALGDYYGRRRIFLLGLAGFGVTSVACGLAPTLEVLALARVLQGVAGALLVPGSLSVITSTFQGPARARAFGLWAASTSALSTLGPPIGGILVEAAGWRSVFLVNVPLIVIALWLASRWMTESRDETASGSFDWLGAATAAIAVGGLAFGAVRGYQQQWRDTAALVSLAVGGVATVAFPFLMAARPNPLVPLSLFRIRAFATVNLSTLLIYGAMYAFFGFSALFLQNTLRYSPLAASIVGLPSGIMLSLLSTRVGTLAGRFGARPFMIGGPLVMAAGLLWWVRVPATSAPWQANISDLASLAPPLDTFIDPLPATLLYGLGISLLVAPLTTALMNSVPVRNAGLASAINNALSRVGQPLIAAVVFIVVSGSFYATLAGAVPASDPTAGDLRANYQPLNPPPSGASAVAATAAQAASTDAFHLAAVISAGLFAAGALVNAVGLRRESETAGEAIGPSSSG